MKDSDTTEVPKFKKPVSKGLARFGIVLALMLTLVVGYILGTRNNEFAGYLPFLPQTATQGDLNLSSVEATYQQLKAKFDGKLDSQKLIEGANRGMVEAAGDPHTVYLDPAEAKELSNDLEGTFSGIGAEIGKRDDQLKVITTLDESPAKKSGLQANDVIAKVNDEDATSWSVEKAVSKIRGEKGTTVKLTIIRNDEVKDFTVTRDTITDKSVKTQLLEGNIGLIRISRFAETDTTALARKAAQDFKDQGVKGIVVDVRGNGGGYLQAAVDLASIWLDGNVVVSERTGGKVVEELKADRDPILKGVPTVVLIDGGSASASEILAGALKDNGAATLLGTKTYGKGSVQQIVDLAGGAQLKVTIAKWYTPKGKNIDKEGISPDKKVEFDQKTATESIDNQVRAALEELKQQ